MGGGVEKSGHLLCILPFEEPKEVISRIKKNHPQLKITYIHPDTEKIFAHDQGVPEKVWKEATILATLAALPTTPEIAPNLEFVQFWVAGTNHVVDHPIYSETKIPLCTVSGIHGPNIAEWVLMTFLASSHYYNMMHEWQQKQQWGSGSHIDPRLRGIRDAVGMRLGVLGYGSIGRQVARVCRAMGMDVIAFTANPRNTPESKRDRGFIVPGTGDPDGEIPVEWYSGLDKENLHKFLNQDIDILVLSLPLTKDTKGMIGKEEFDILAKRNAFISNISRGQIIDQDELIKQLKAFDDDKECARGVNGRRAGLRGAALDVVDNEPLPDGHPLFTTPNCIITPHISSLGAAYVFRAFEVLEGNLERWERGDPLINIVDRERGY